MNNTPNAKPGPDPEGWGCFLAAAMVGVVMLWIKDVITWPFRVVRRWFGE